VQRRKELENGMVFSHELRLCKPNLCFLSLQLRCVNLFQFKFPAQSHRRETSNLSCGIGQNRSKQGQGEAEKIPFCTAIVETSQYLWRSAQCGANRHLWKGVVPGAWKPWPKMERYVSFATWWKWTSVWIWKLGMLFSQKGKAQLQLSQLSRKLQGCLPTSLKKTYHVDRWFAFLLDFFDSSTQKGTPRYLPEDHVEGTLIFLNLQVVPQAIQPLLSTSDAVFQKRRSWWHLGKAGVRAWMWTRLPQDTKGRLGIYGFDIGLMFVLQKRVNKYMVSKISKWMESTCSWAFQEVYLDAWYTVHALGLLGR